MCLCTGTPHISVLLLELLMTPDDLSHALFSSSQERRVFLRGEQLCVFQLQAFVLLEQGCVQRVTDLITNI
jgi:hypothetical protein